MRAPAPRFISCPICLLFLLLPGRHRLHSISLRPIEQAIYVLRSGRWGACIHIVQVLAVKCESAVRNLRRPTSAKERIEGVGRYDATPASFMSQLHVITTYRAIAAFIVRIFRPLP